MRIIYGDITKMETDAIVNAASSDLMPVPGISSAIFEAADTEALKNTCRKIGRCRIGHAVVSPLLGFRPNLSSMWPAQDGTEAQSGNTC